MDPGTRGEKGTWRCIGPILHGGEEGHCHGRETSSTSSPGAEGVLSHGLPRLDPERGVGGSVVGLCRGPFGPERK